MSLQDVIELHLQNYRDLFKNLYAIYSYYVVSTILISARLFARLYMLKNGGLDDTFAVIAFICLIVMISIHHAASIEVSQSEDPMAIVHEYTYNWSAITYELSYFCGSLFVRLSVVALLQRLAKREKQKKLILLLYIIFGTFTFALSVATVVILKTIGEETESGSSQGITLLVHAAVLVLTDLALFVAPIRMFCTRMMDKTKMVKMILIFSVGIITLAAGITRIVYLVRDVDLLEQLQVAQDVYFWTNLEGHTSLWVACFPALQPIIRFVSSRIGLATSMISSRVVTSSSQQQSRHSFKHWRPRSHYNNHHRHHQYQQQDSFDTLQPGYIMQQRSISSTVSAATTTTATNNNNNNDNNNSNNKTFQGNRPDSLSFGTQTKISANVHQREIDPANNYNGQRDQERERERGREREQDIELMPSPPPNIHLKDEESGRNYP